MAKSKLLICPYCGDAQPAGDHCRVCGGLFEQLSRQASHNAMGPWFIRNDERPFQPGCSYETMVRLIERGQVNKLTIIRGPTTKQFWTVAKRAAGIAHLLGYCPQCDASVDPGDHGCHACGVPFGAYLDRNYMGLPEIRPLPWEADVEGELAVHHHDRPGSLQMSPSTHGRISSFATDAELLHGGGSGAADAESYMPGLGASSGRAAATGESAPSIATATATEPVGAPEAKPAFLPDDGPLARAMRRRIARQQRSIRMLAVALAVIVFLLVLTNLRPLGLLGPSGSPPAAMEPTPSSTERAVTPPTGPADVGMGSRTDPDAEQPPAMIDADDPIDPDASGDAQPDVALDEPPVTLDSPENDHARALLVAAARSDRPLDERLTDCEAALALLRELQDAGLGDTAKRERIIEQAVELQRKIVGEFYAEDGV